MITRRVFLVMASVFAEAASVHAETWVRYVNDRFGTFIFYPADIFSEQMPSDNDDGGTFIADDGGRLLVFGRYNVLGQTLKEIEAALSGPDYDHVTYRGHGKRWFVVSGQRKGEESVNIFYEKYILSPDSKTIHTMLFIYPLPRRRRYDSLIKRLVASFGPLN